MSLSAFETLHVYQHAERLAAEIGKVMPQWSIFARDTVGKQLVRAADSIVANLAEGYGRGTNADKRRFILISRGSFNETLCWLRRSDTPSLLTPEQSRVLLAITNELGPRLNAYLNYVNKQMKTHSKTSRQPKPPTPNQQLTTTNPNQ